MHQLGLFSMTAMTGVTRRQAADAKRLRAKADAARAGHRQHEAQRELREVIREEKARGGKCPRVLRP